MSVRKKITVGLLTFLLLTSGWLVNRVRAGVSCALPFTLTNGTIADATQVMANYNALVTCLGNAASAGANSDITSLLGLLTPLAPSAGGSNVFLGATSTGSANAQAVASPVPAGFTFANNSTVIFIAGFTNNSSMTLAVNGLAATAVLRQTPTGLAALSGGEVVVGQAVNVFYDGTQFELINAAPQALVPACTVIDYGGVATPSGYLPVDGSAISRATYPTLFSCITVSGVAATLNSTMTIGVPNSALFQVGWYVGGANVTCNSTITSIPGGGVSIVINNSAGATGSSTLTIGPYPQGDCSTTFTLPNYQGRGTVMADLAGGTLSAVACPNPGTLGSNCGSTTQTIPLASLPTGITSSGVNGITLSSTVSDVLQGPGPAGFTFGGNGSSLTGVAVSNSTVSSGVNVSGSAAISVTSNNTSGTAMLLQPVGLVTKAIKF